MWKSGTHTISGLKERRGVGVRLFVKIRLLEGGWIKYCCDVTNMVFTERPAERKGDILHPCALSFRMRLRFYMIK